MATLTIKIDSEDLAREVLAHLGYLPDDGDDDNIPDLVEVEDPVEKSPVIDAFKTWYRTNTEPTEDPSFPKPTRKMPDTPKQNEFCTTEEPKLGVEPVDKNLGAPLQVYSDETKKENDELYKQCMEIRKSIPSAEERLKAQVDELWGGDRLDYLDALAEHPDKEMREAVKAYVLREYTEHDLKFWPALKKILDT